VADVPDPYGIDLAIDATGDVIVTPSGAIATVDGPQNCVQALVARMLTGPGELTQHPEYGSTFKELVGSKFSLPIIQGAAANEVRQIVDEDPRFLAGQNITAEPIAGAPTSARVSLELLLTGGDSLVVTDLAGPGVEVTDTPTAPRQRGPRRPRRRGRRGRRGLGLPRPGRGRARRAPRRRPHEHLCPPRHDGRRLSGRLALPHPRAIPAGPHHGPAGGRLEADRLLDRLRDAQLLRGARAAAQPCARSCSNSCARTRTSRQPSAMRST
jgi:hypothetical protein